MISFGVIYFSPITQKYVFMKRMLFFFFCVFLSPGANASNPSDENYTLTVYIKNFKNAEGQVAVAYFDSKESFLKEGKGRFVPLEDKNRAKVVFENVKKGALAISVYHDKNANGKLDKGFLGIPTEDYGFSNNAKGYFGPPAFKDCLVQIDAHTTVEIDLQGDR